MIYQYNANQFAVYNKARTHFINNPAELIALEQFLTNELARVIRADLSDIKRDYNEASYLFPFWANYPPEDRGRSPIKDQYPWIEVGEHSIGCKLPRLLSTNFSIRDTGLPTGSDQRFVLTSPAILKATSGATDSAWFFVDIKSIGPRDDQDHTVMSHNQVSGDGIWLNPAGAVLNGLLRASGARASHDFHASMPPLFVLSDGTVAPLVNIALKPVYKMLPAKAKNLRNEGQPLDRIDIACIPNGLLLTQNPGYLGMHNGLLFPGKDDKSKDPRKLRARVSFALLKTIAPWRVQSISVPFP
jgi:hypothetical protein